MSVHSFTLPKPLMDMAYDAGCTHLWNQLLGTEDKNDKTRSVIYHLGKYLKNGSGDETGLRRTLLTMESGKNKKLLTKYLDHIHEWVAVKDTLADVDEKVEKHLLGIEGVLHSPLCGLHTSAFTEIHGALNDFDLGIDDLFYADYIHEKLGETSKVLRWGIEDYFEDVMKSFDKTYSYTKNTYLEKQLGHFVYKALQKLPKIREKISKRSEFDSLRKVVGQAEKFFQEREHLAVANCARVSIRLQKQYMEQLTPKPHWMRSALNAIMESDWTHGAVLFGFAFILYNQRQYDFSPRVMETDENDRIIVERPTVVDREVGRLASLLDEKHSSLNAPFRNHLLKDHLDLDRWIRVNQHRFAEKPSAEFQKQLLDEYRIHRGQG